LQSNYEPDASVGVSDQGDVHVSGFQHKSVLEKQSQQMPAPLQGKRLLLLVDATIRDLDLNKAIRRLRMKKQHELLVSFDVSQLCIFPV
jgi:hypothetical protein